MLQRDQEAIYGFTSGIGLRGSIPGRSARSRYLRGLCIVDAIRRSIAEHNSYEED